MNIFSIITLKQRSGEVLQQQLPSEPWMVEEGEGKRQERAMEQNPRRETERITWMTALRERVSGECFLREERWQRASIVLYVSAKGRFFVSGGNGKTPIAFIFY